MTLTPQIIKDLLEDLYTADPSLRAREKDLVKAIQAIASAKPNASMDKKFLQTLRIELLNKAKTLSSMNPLHVPEKPKARMLWPIVSFATSGVAIMSIALLLFTQNGSLPRENANTPVAFSDQVAFHALSIDRVEDGAFGDIQSASNDAMAESLAYTGNSFNGAGGIPKAISNVAMPISAPVADAEGDVSRDASSPQTAVSSASAPMMDTKMVMPPYQETVVEYVYAGDSIELSDEKLDVYKKTNGMFEMGRIASMIGGLNLGVTDLSTFQGSRVADISVYQDQPFGYQIYISPRNGIMSIDQNWEQWQSAYPTCQDDACWRSSQLTESDVPSDEELLKIADAFLTDHRIDRSAYGDGDVDKSWKTNTISFSPDSQYSIPDVVTVTYPLMVDGKPTYAGGGMKSGITVSVNIRVKKVSAVYNIQSIKMSASSYDGITDTNTILESAKKGGMSSSMRYMDESMIAEAKKVQAELGTPIKALVQIYQYKDNENLELYVPALIFPVTKRPDFEGASWMVPNAIVVPLVKGFEQDIPQIMPMMRSGEGSSGSSSVAMPEPAIDTMVPTDIVAPAPENY